MIPSVKVHQSVAFLLLTDSTAAKNLLMKIAIGLDPTETNRGISAAILVKTFSIKY